MPLLLHASYNVIKKVKILFDQTPEKKIKRGDVMISIEIESEKLKPFVDRQITYAKSKINEQEEEIQNQINQYETNIMTYNQKPFLKRCFSFKPKDPRNDLQHQHLAPISVDKIIIYHLENHLYKLNQLNERLKNKDYIKITKSELNLLNVDITIQNNPKLTINERG